MTGPADAELGRVVVLGGGAVGMLVVAALHDHCAGVTVVDRRPAAEGAGRSDHVVADVTAPADLPAWVAALRAASVIVLSLPESVITAVLPILADHANDTALIVETSSVKTDVASAVRTSWAGRPALGVNPLFRPSLGMAGRRVAVVTYVRGGADDAVERALTAQGAELLRVAVAEHDQLAAVTQTLTHACLLVFGAAVAQCRSEVSAAGLMDFAPPPFRALLALAVRVAAGDVAVYQEIQDAESGARMRAAVSTALGELDAAAGDPAAFARLQTRIRAAVGPELVAELVDSSETLLSNLR